MFGVDDLIMGGLNAGASMLNTSSNNEAAMQRQQEAEQFNAHQAEINRNFQERMSSSAYQRAHADMLAAGLNPILAAGASSSTPGGSSASITQSSASGSGIGDAMSKMISTAQQNKQLDAAVSLQKQQLENAKYSADNIQADTAKKMADTTNVEAVTQNVHREGKIKDEVLQTAIAEAAKAKTDAEFYNSPAGRILRLTGLGGREVSNTVSPVGSIVGSARGVQKLLNPY